MSELLPCPFCGHDDQLYPAHHFPGTGPAYAIDCLRCGIDFTPREGMDVAAKWNTRASQAEIERLKEALTPSGETKAAYIGEFQFTVTMLELDESDEPYECQRMVTVPWTTIKEIMAAISERAALGTKP